MERFHSLSIYYIKGFLISEDGSLTRWNDGYSNLKTLSEINPSSVSIKLGAPAVLLFPTGNHFPGCNAQSRSSHDIAGPMFVLENPPHAYRSGRAVAQEVHPKRIIFFRDHRC